jgi:heterodisulfide reductase subunit A
MVIGGGIAGLTAAWELAQQGVEVDLVEKGAFLGGHAIQYCCKATDQCLECGACSVEAMLKNVLADTRIRIHLGAEVESLSRKGRFAVRLRHGAPQLDADHRGFSKNNIASAAARQQEPIDSLEADAVVVATGFSPFDPARKPTYGYGRLANIITGLELERNKRLAGAVLRPSDAAVPKRVAFIQCVGSRDERLGHLWCSHVCCPYALRMARNLKYHEPDTEITVFYMDIQNTSKSFPAFYEGCREQMRFVRAIPVDMYQTEREGLRTRYMDEQGNPVDEEFDLVVLSIGIMPGVENTRLVETLGIDLDRDGFMQSADRLQRTTTTREGVFLAGTVEGPKTIAASMAHAGQAAGEVVKFLGGVK